MRQLILPGYEWPVRVGFSPCGRWLYGSCMTCLAIWDLPASNAEPTWKDEHNSAMLFAFTVSPAGRFVAGAEDRCVVVWDVIARSKAKWIAASQTGDHISDVAFTPDGRDLLTVCIDGEGGVQRWRTGSWRRKPAFGNRSKLDGALTVSPDGRTVATGAIVGKRPALKLWTYPTGTHQKTATPTGASFRRLTFSPNGSVIASEDDDWRRVQVWDSKTLARIAEYSPKLKAKRKDADLVRAVAFHPSGRYLVVTGGTGLVEFLDTSTWLPVKAFDWQLGSMASIAFSPDGMLAAAGSDTGKVVVWDVDL